MNKTSRKNTSKKNFLDYVPYINPINTFDTSENIITINMIHSGFYHKAAQKLCHTPKISHIDLDSFGSYIWQQIDGSNTIYDISQMVKQKFGDKAEPLYERIVKYFQILRNNKLVIMK